jgi:hypothetical protein
MVHTMVIGNKVPESGKASFRLEREMLNSARLWLESRGLTARTEFALPWGICDLVGISFFKSRVKQRLALGQKSPIGTPRKIDLLNRIPDATSGRSVTISGLKRQLVDFVEPDQIDSDIESLIASRFVVRRTSNTLQKLNGWMPLSKRLVAIELKLNRVSEAFSQAKAHQHIADEVYIGLPQPVATRIVESGRKHHFKASGVGILSITDDACSVLLPCRKIEVEPYSVLKAHCVERMWRSSIKDKSS